MFVVLLIVGPSSQELGPPAIPGRFKPFAGGSAIAIQLLLQGYVSRIAINDLSAPIFSFWDSVLSDSNRLIEKILNVPLSVEEWDRQKAVLRDNRAIPSFDLGFAAFYLNRTNRSGVLSGGIIGGRAQRGEWLIDARFNREELSYRVERIAYMRDQIDLSREDAVAFLRRAKVTYPKNKTLFYADPPYFVKGRQLYLDYYHSGDHKLLADFIKIEMSDRFWLVSYDDVEEVRNLYSGRQISAYSIPYSVRASSMGTEVMFYSDRIRLPFDPQGNEIGPADRFVA